MDGWKLTFNYSAGGNRINLEFTGADQAIRVGIGIAGQVIGERVKKMFSAGAVPSALFEDAMRLSGIIVGEPVTAYRGKYLSVVPVKNVAGLTSSVSVEWKD